MQAIVGRVAQATAMLAANDVSPGSDLPHEELRPLPTADNGRQNERAKGLEP